MLKTQIDVVSLMNSVSAKVTDSFDSASIVVESETPKELIDSSEQLFNSISDDFQKDFNQYFQEAYVAELIKQLEEQSVSFN